MFEEFRAAIEAAGLEPPEEIIFDGRIHRFASNGKRGDSAGWYIGFDDGIPAGSFGDWRTGISQLWQANIGRTLTPAEQAAHRAKVETMKREREAEQERRHSAAAKSAAIIFEAASGDPESHPYSIKKFVPLGDHVKRGPWPQRGWEDALLVPLYGTDGKMWTIQAIDTDSSKDKDYLWGGKKRGCFYPFGKISNAEQIFVGEGIATVAAAFSATGVPSVAAMDCGNLLPVAQAIKKLAPSAEIVFLADNDIKADGTYIGVKTATEAARAIGASIAIPELEGREPCASRRDGPQRLHPTVPIHDPTPQYSH